MKLNRKGYMLIEIILASAIAFGVGYFILQMVINLKNKNDDLLVETLTTTDQTIIMNKLMQYAKSEGKDFSCDKLTIDGNVIKYGDEVIDIVNDYATIGNISCDYTDELLKISVPLNVKQLSNKDFDVKLDYNPTNGSVSPGLYTIKFVCDDYNISGNEYWNGDSSDTEFQVACDQTFNIIPLNCASTVSGNRQYRWTFGSQEVAVGAQFKFSDFRNCDSGDKTLIFNAGWSVGSSGGGTVSPCGKCTMDSQCIGGGTCTGTCVGSNGNVFSCCIINGMSCN